jgi:hypothetical protein
MAPAIPHQAAGAGRGGRGDGVSVSVGGAAGPDPGGTQKLTSAEYDYRGGKPSEPRREVSRKTVAEFWAYANNGAEVPEKLLGQIKETASGIGTLEIVDFGATARMYDNLPAIAEQDRDYDAHAARPPTAQPRFFNFPYLAAAAAVSGGIVARGCGE